MRRDVGCRGICLLLARQHIWPTFASCDVSYSRRSRRAGARVARTQHSSDSLSVPLPVSACPLSHYRQS
eukprot:7379174-Prymnesium_polylepis.1